MDDRFQRQALSKVPLAEAVLTVVRHLFDSQKLAELYEKHRGRGYEREISFFQVVQIFWSCLTGPWESVRNGLVKARDEDQLPVSLMAFYQKVSRMPIAVTCELFRECSARLQEVLPCAAAETPESLKPFDVLVVDGKTIKHVERRRPALRMSRENACSLLGGCGLVARERWSGVAFDLALDLDGVANEIKHFSALITQIGTRSRSFLVIGDRAFGLYACLETVLAQTGGQFLFRQHGITKFSVDSSVSETVTKDRLGRTVTERWGTISRGRAKGIPPGTPIRVRQITVLREKGTLVLLTSLIDATAVSADVLLDAYLDRWDIENMFQTITDVFGLKPLSSSTAQGTLFQFVLCLLMYNVIQLVKHYLATCQNKQEKELSSEMLFRDVAEELIAAARMIDPVWMATAIVLQDTITTRRRIHELLKDCWQNRWKKSNIRVRDPSKRRTEPPKKIKQKKTHDSVYRLLKQT